MRFDTLPDALSLSCQLSRCRNLVNYGAGIILSNIKLEGYLDVMIWVTVVFNLNFYIIYPVFVYCNCPQIFAIFLFRNIHLVL